MEGDEGGIFSNAPDRKPLFLLKKKTKQKPGYSNKEYNASSTCIKLSGLIPEVKKSALNNDYENIIRYR